MAHYQNDMSFLLATSELFSYTDYRDKSLTLPFLKAGEFNQLFQNVLSTTQEKGKNT